MFPLREPSRFNPDAPLVTDADVEAFRADPAILEALRRSFGRFLAFLGLAMEGGKVVEGPDFGRKATSGDTQPQLAEDHPGPGQHADTRPETRAGLLRVP